MKIYIIRHGETELNRQGIVQGGGVDASLNETGISQATAFYECYKNISFDALLSSTLKRTHETIAPFVKDGITWEQHAEINEISWGVLEGKKPDAAMIETYAKITASWDAGDFDAAIEEGESALQLGNRLSQFIEMLKQKKADNVLVCMHGRSMRALVCLLKGQGLDQMSMFPHSNTGLYLVNYENDRFSFDLENDTSHLTAR